MYAIFESQLYLNRIVFEIDDPTVDVKNNTIINKNTNKKSNDLDLNSKSNNKTDKSTNTLKSETTTSKPTPKIEKPIPIDDSINDDIPDIPNSNIPENDVPEEKTESENFQSIQKFILFNKLRELQYKLTDIGNIGMYKNKKSLFEFIKFLEYVITFFSIFNYDQAFKLTERILIEFKSIK